MSIAHITALINRLSVAVKLKTQHPIIKGDNIGSLMELVFIPATFAQIINSKNWWNYNNELNQRKRVWLYRGFLLDCMVIKDVVSDVPSL